MDSNKHAEENEGTTKIAFGGSQGGFIGSSNSFLHINLLPLDKINS